MTPERVDVAVVGAGLAGLAAAGELAAADRTVVLLDKGRRPGGRCATRELGGAVLDTGAQFFTVRSEAFRARVDRWTAEGCPIVAWAEGFAQAGDVRDGPAAAEAGGDGHPRYGVVGGVNGLAAHLARGLDVRSSTRVVSIGRDAEGWVVATADRAWQADAVVATPPTPQTRRLLAAGGAKVDDDLSQRLEGLTYEACLTLMLALDRDPALPAPGGVQIADGAIWWMADARAKRASTAPGLVAHASADLSAALYAEPDRAIVDRLLPDVAAWLGDATPTATEVFRWRYAKPEQPADDEAVVVSRTATGPLVLAGDVWAGAKVEGAVTSGLAAAARVLDEPHRRAAGRLSR